MIVSSRVVFKIAIVVSVLAVFCVLLACTKSPNFVGTVMNPVRPAPDFDLLDQSGNPVSLSKIKSDIIVLTFLYSYCPDVCPSLISKLKYVERQLDKKSDKVRFLIVSLDPERATPKRAQEYLDQWKLSSRWSFLLGSEDVLSNVWTSYYVDPTRIDWASKEITRGAPGLSDSGVESLYNDIAERYEISHVAPIYLIDSNKQMRVFFTSTVDKQSLVHDILQLLDSS